MFGVQAQRFAAKAETATVHREWKLALDFHARAKQGFLACRAMQASEATVQKKKMSF